MSASASKAGKGKDATEKRKPERQGTFSGMQQVRNVRLDRFCEDIGADRDTMNQARQSEQSAIQGALSEMQAKGIQAYKHQGVVLMRQPGGEKLSVKVLKDRSETGDTSDAKAPADTADSGAVEGSALDDRDPVNDAETPF